MTELEFEQLEDRVSKGRKIAFNIKVMKRERDNLKHLDDTQIIGITYLGSTIYTSKTRFMELLDKSISDYEELLEKL